MKRHVIFLTLTLFFVIILSGAVSAADTNGSSNAQQTMQSSNIIIPPVQLLPKTVNNRTRTLYWGSDSINKAIQDINTTSGDTLLISNGTYDSVTLNKNLTLKWDGTGTGAVVSQLNITRGGSGSTINRLDINYSSTYSATGQAGIYLNGANNVTIENCTVNGFESGAGIWMVNSNNNTIVSTRLTDNKNGIGLNSSNGNDIGVSGSTLNSITGTGATSAPVSYGIYMFSSANNEIYGINIGTDAGSSRGFIYGIYLDHATGNNTIDSSNVWCNGAGIVLNWSNATITDNTEVGYNLNDGIDLYNSTAIINSYNYIDNNGGNGINVENSTVTINSRNNIYANGQNGINSLDSTIDVENNTIGGSASDGNGYNGIYITYTSPSTKCNTINGNGIQNNGQSGDCQGICLNNAAGNNLIQSNTISGNSYGGIYSHNSNTAIGSNTINNNSDAGIDLIYSHATVQNNTISENAFEGIEAICSNVTIKNNPGINNNNDGIFLRGSNATVQNNTLSENKGDGIDVIYSDATVQNNTILFNALNGIYLVYSNATINNSNNIYANGQNGINSQDSTVDVENNTVGSDGASSNPTSGNGYNGILINYSTPSTNVNTIKGNKIRNNVGKVYTTGYGIYIEDTTGDNLIQSNTISSNNYGGICSYNSNTTIGSNTINNNGDGIFLRYSNATIQNNIISENTFEGIEAICSNVTIQNNPSIINNEDGVYLNDSNTTIESNTINNNGDGIDLIYSNATVQNNTVFSNVGDGIYLTNSNATIQNNTIGNNAKYQIYFTNSNSASGIISNNIYGNYGLFFDANNQLVQFNRIITSIEAIRNTGTGTVTATLNWFGSNNNPSSKMFNNGSGVINCSPWLVLTLTANPTLIKAEGTSIITADLLHDSQGVYHDPVGGHAPDGIPVNFAGDSLGGVNPVSSTTVNGKTITTFTAGSTSGVSYPLAIVDNQLVNTSITVDTITPTTKASLSSGLYNVNKIVYLTMSEAGSIYYTTDGTTPTKSSKLYNGSVIITSTTTLKFIAVDLAGNPSTVYSQTYTIDKISPKVTSTYPKNKAIGASRTKTIYLKFSEKIKSSVKWSKVYVKNIGTGKKISISKLIKGNMLYIKTSKRSAYTWYQVYIPAYAIKDYAGNKLAKGYTFKFKTGKY